MEIKGKKAVIVGGASGMAKASAELLRQKGADIAILDLPTSAGAEVAKELGGTFHEVDVLDDAQTETAMADAVAALGGLHIAVNTAGGGTAKRTLTKEGPHPLEDFREIIELNLIGTFNLNRLQAFYMSTNEPEDGERGVIIDTASIAAFEGQIGQVAYTAAKAGIVGMMLTMARDLGSLGIRVMAIAPSLFSTGLTKGIPDEFAKRADQGRRLPQAHGPARGVRQAGRRHRGEPDAQRPAASGSTPASASPPSRRRRVSAVRAIDLQVDVTAAAGLGEPAHVALTVTVPDELARGPDRLLRQARRRLRAGLLHRGPAGTGIRRAGQLACRPRLDLRVARPPGRGRQLPTRPRAAVVHAGGRGESGRRGRRAAEAGGGHPDRRTRPRSSDPVTIGIGQSMGGCLTIVQQGRYHCYDGIGVLGYSAVHTHPPTAPGTPPIVSPWVPRDALPSDGIFTNGPALSEVTPGEVVRIDAMAWGFHFDDVDPAVVTRDLDDFPARRGDVPPWGSATVPMTVALWCLAPGAVLPEAAAIRCPVLVAHGRT